MKNVCLLGSTGSIGQNTLEVVARHSNEFSISILVTNRNINLLAQQIAKFKPEYAVIYNYDSFQEFKKVYNFGDARIGYGIEGVLDALQGCKIDVFVNAFVGFAGLQPTVEAIKSGIPIALANKETLVVAGNYINTLLQKHKVPLIPIDSEHSAIWQCLAGEQGNKIKRIILTASGGPFRTKKITELDNVTPQEALKHPNWKMGAKISIDSATLMNKGLEVIEAFWLYHVAVDKIQVIIHPQSIIHSMVEFIDNSIKAQLGIPDMRIPIQYALSYPYRIDFNESELDFEKFNKLTFEKPNLQKFPCLEIAFEALKEGRTYPAAINAANEVAVEAFLKHKIKFSDIPVVIRNAMENHSPIDAMELNDYFRVDRDIRNYITNLLNMKQKC
jgi:1-deoxy-D-xylulose-5-phosphate reductoisomerase